MTSPRYAIGIDLGTTNCVLAYVDLRTQPFGAKVLPIAQLHSLDSLVESPLLPSYFYYVTDAESGAGQINPFTGSVDEGSPGYVVGVAARERMSGLPGRVIDSAKSWLAHGGIDREAPILPFGSEDIAAELQLSPVEASATYLAYLCEAWDHAFARHDADNAFVKQHIVITVPASFDEGAQALTRKAAELAGYPDTLRLLEEPQAAFYVWLASAASAGNASASAQLLERLPALASEPQTVLVCDIGGGTCDFSLFRIAALADARARPAIERIATSDHLLLGGDNIDLALAHLLEPLLKPGADERLSRQQWSRLVPQARALKEKVLDAAAETEDERAAAFRVSIPGDGAGLFASALSATVSRDAVEQTVLEGFFPLTPVDEMPRTRRSGLREIGLPYAADTAVSRHLAAFLRGRPIDAVLFAGGTLQPRLLQRRLVTLIESWQGKRSVQLVLPDMSLAIAQGAAEFGALTCIGRERIGGGYPRSVYLELQRENREPTSRLVCVLPQGFQEGRTLKLASPVFELLVNRPARFGAYTSNRRKDDVAGSIVALDPTSFHPLPALNATLTLADAGANPRQTAMKRVSVQLEARLTELGVLQLALVNEPMGKRWRLDFNLRKPLAVELSGVARESTHSERIATEPVNAARARIALLYGKKQTLDARDNVKHLIRDLEQILNQERHSWGVTLMRSLWPALYAGIGRRARSLAHEITWLYLAGFLLRPGYGSELDQWRMSELARCLDVGVVHRHDKRPQSNWWMMWRRTAGGLSAEQQERLFEAAMRELKKSGSEFSEGTRLLGSLERVAVPDKVALAAMLFDLIVRGKAANQPHIFWALGRLLSRVPLYTSVETVLPAAVVEDYFSRVASLDWNELGMQPLNLVFSLACRLTNIRALDVHDSVRARVIDKMKRADARPEQVRIVREHCEVSAADRNDLFGEQLPAGLRLSTVEV